MDLIVLAGGLGTRLKSVIDDLPKPMAPIKDKPFLYHLLDWASQYEIDKIVLATGYLSEKIEDYFGNSFRGIPVEYSVETKRLGTGGAIALALEKCTSEDLVIVNGDTYFPVDLSYKTDANFTLALKEMSEFSRYGSVNLAADGGVITKFNEKAYCEKGLINGGIYFAKRAFLLRDFPEVFSFETEFLEKEVLAGNLHGQAFEETFIDIGIPEDYNKAIETLAVTKKKALFLDRDGVINIDHGYVHSISEFDFREEIFDLCLAYQKKNYSIFIITNQAGIARGMYDDGAFNKLMDWVHKEFAKRGVAITQVYRCPHHPDFTGDCDCRKPAPGMLLKAALEYNIDLENSVLIGNKMSDINAGKNAGVGTNYLVSEEEFVLAER